MKEKITTPKKVKAPAGVGLLGTFDLIGMAFSIFKKRWKTLIMIQIIPAVLALIFGVLSVFMNSGEARGEELSPLLGLGVLVLVIPVIFLGIWSSYAMMLAVINHKQEKGWKDFYRESIHLFWGLLGITILVTLITFGGFLLLIVPGFIFAVWYGYATWIYAEKGKGSGLINAIRESKRIVKGYFWSIVWRNLVFGVLAGIAIMIVAGILGLIGLAFGGIFGQSEVVVTLINDIFGLPIQVIVAPVSMLFAYLLFSNVRDLKNKGIDKKPLERWVKILVPIIIVVVLIVPGMLSLVAVKALNVARMKSRDATRTQELNQIKIILDIYQGQNGIYPDDLTELNILLPVRNMSDPLTGELYNYQALEGSSGFKVCAELEVIEQEGEYCIESGDDT
ncbi:hypothetical protein HQ544_05020 [Candidatus Falkowbacteria bacterium]|nr:hypothetical protein [Candidatus Falkowbacteria bacterium]